MSTEMKTGLVLSGGGAVGAYQAGVVKALAECGTQISMVSGASIGAFNGAIIAASTDLSEAAVRLEALWDHLGNNQVLSVNRLVYFSLLKKLFQAMNLCQIPGRAGALLTTLLRHISTINGFDNLMAQPLLSDEPLTALMDHYLDTDALADGLPLYVSLYPTEGGMQDIIDCIRAELGVGTTKNAVFQHIQSLPVNSLTGNLIMKLPVKLLMSLISLVSVIARAGEYKNYSRDEIKYWRYTSYKGGKLPEGFTDEKFSSAIYNGRIFTMKRLHTLMLFLAVLFTGFNFNAEAATVKQALSCNPEAWAEQPGACPSTYELYEGDATYKAAIDKALKPVGLSGMFGKGGYMDGPGGGITPVNINGTVWFQGDGCKANTCGWDFIVTLYNPKTHEVVGYRYFGLDDPAYLVWFGEIGVHEFAYLVKNYVAAVN